MSLRPSRYRHRLWRTLLACLLPWSGTSLATPVAERLGFNALTQGIPVSDARPWSLYWHGQPLRLLSFHSTLAPEDLLARLAPRLTPPLQVIAEAGQVQVSEAPGTTGSAPRLVRILAEGGGSRAAISQLDLHATPTPALTARLVPAGGQLVVQVDDAASAAGHLAVYRYPTLSPERVLTQLATRLQRAGWRRTAGEDSTRQRWARATERLTTYASADAWLRADASIDTSPGQTLLVLQHTTPATP